MQGSAVEPSAAAVTDAFVQASRALVAVAVRSLADVPGDVTLAQYRALVVLTSRGKQRAAQLAHELGVAPSSATRLCDRLARKDLIERRTAPNSRREIEIEVTDVGRALVDQVTVVRRQDIARILAAIPTERWATLIEALEEFADAAGEVPDQAWSLGWPS
jgi:DNA-binding MarR family transcriptional regulator